MTRTCGQCADAGHATALGHGKVVCPVHPERVMQREQPCGYSKGDLMIKRTAAVQRARRLARLCRAARSGSTKRHDGPLTATEIERQEYPCPGPDRRPYRVDAAYPEPGTMMSIDRCLHYPDCGCAVYDRQCDLWKAAQEREAGAGNPDRSAALHKPAYARQPPQHGRFPELKGVVGRRPDRADDRWAAVVSRRDDEGMARALGLDDAGAPGEEPW